MTWGNLTAYDRKTRYLMAVSKLDGKWDEADADEQARLLGLLEAVIDDEMIIDIRPRGVVT